MRLVALALLAALARALPEDAPAWIVQVNLTETNCRAAAQHFEQLPHSLRVTDTIEGPSCFIIISTHIEPEDLRDIAGNPSWIEDIEEDSPVRAAGLWHLDRLNQRALPLDGDEGGPDLTGEGVTVFVLDTGVSAHPELLRAGDDDPNGHGTHVASLAAGANVGVAPGARVEGIRVLDEAGNGTTSTALRGLARVAQLSNGGDIVNLSFEGPASRAMSRAVRDVARLGNLVVAAAGNGGSDACEGFAADPAVIAVGAAARDDTVSRFSNFGPCVDIYAPGEEVAGAALDGGYETRSGTSVAAPLVSGLLALLMEHSGSAAAARAHLFALSVPVDAFGRPGGPLRLASGAGIDDLDEREEEEEEEEDATMVCAHAFVNGTAEMGCAEHAASLFGPSLAEHAVTGEFYLLKGANRRLCRDPSRRDARKMRGRIAIVKRGKCRFFDKVRRAEAAGAIGVIFHRGYGGRLFSPTYNGDSAVGIPSAMVRLGDVDGLRELKRSADDRTLSVYMGPAKN